MATMPNNPLFSTSLNLQSPISAKLQDLSPLELAQALAERLTITDMNWHKNKSNRHARACEQAAVALVFLLKENPEEAIAHLNQATGWLDRSISAPPCPTHGDRRQTQSRE